MSKLNKYKFSFIDKEHNTRNAIIHSRNRENAEKSFYDFYGNSLDEIGSIIEIEELENYDY